MATLMTRLIVPIINLLATSCFAPAVSLDSPGSFSPPKCYIPCNEEYINCTWDAWLEPSIPTNYSLHWRDNSNEQHVSTGNNLSGRIDRDNFRNGKITVWVQAKNQNGSTNSEEFEFNTIDIIKPPPPEIQPDLQDPLDIFWKITCKPEQSGECDIRLWTEEDPTWHEESGVFGSYSVDNLKPCVRFEFQVRCSLPRSLKSDWSAIHRGQENSAPVGKLDVWRDCGLSSASSDCVLTWKRLSRSQGCGLILGYEVRLSYTNGTVVALNLSTTVPAGQLVCDDRQCHLNSSLRDVSSVSISAHNSHGATIPSYLAMRASGKEGTGHLSPPKMSEEKLTVSWDHFSQILKNLHEYVVQYKQAGSPPGQGFDWVKMDKSQTSAAFNGRFKKYTPYEVSLFTVSDGNQTHHHASVIGYSLQGTPPRVPSFKVSSIGDTSVELTWEPVPLVQQTGNILYYQIGVDGRPKKYNVSAQRENTVTVKNLSPGQQYDVWIRAMTEAGFGEKLTMNFETKHEEYEYLSTSIGIGSLVICFVLVSVCVCLYHGKNKACPLLCLYKVPDPRNSGIFKEMKHQINDSMVWMCIPINEPHPKICLLEIVEIHPLASKTSPKMDGDVSCQGELMEDAVQEESRRTNRKSGKEAYSRMVDSDEENDRVEEEEEEEEEEEDRRDCWSTSEDEQYTSVPNGGCKQSYQAQSRQSSPAAPSRSS